jgi:hypothetical protein
MINALGRSYKKEQRKISRESFRDRSSIYNLYVFWKHCSLIGDIYTDYQHFSIHFPSLKKLDLHSFLSRDRFLSGCPALETLDTYFDDGSSMKEVFATPSSNSMSLKSTNDNFTWTYLQINGQSLGIVSYLQSMVEAFLHVFPPCESEFIDPILKDLRDYFHEITLCSRYSTSKVKFYFIFMVYMLLYM